MVDVAGVGLNAADTLIRIPQFPALDSKLEYLSADIRPGGQVASALVACRRWGLSVRYIGTVGDDDAAEMHWREFQGDGVETHLFTVAGCRSQRAYILIDQKSGERTILWNRDARLTLKPGQTRREWIFHARALLVDGHDTPAAAEAARWAHEAGIPVVADVDNLYPGVEALLENVDYLMASRDFPARLLSGGDFFKTLPELQRRYRSRVAGVTLGRDGALAWDGSRFRYSPALRVETVDTTGAGDIFHGAFVYALLQKWPVDRILKFSCAAAGLNCTAVGAREGIRPLPEIIKAMDDGARRPALFEQDELDRQSEKCRRH